MGGDWYVYLRTFNRLANADLNTALSSTDSGYGFVNWIVGQLGLRIWGVNVVCALIFTAGLLRLAREQPNPRLALATAIPYLVIVVAMGYTRQSVALGFIMLGLSQFLRGATVSMLISFALATAFHKSAVIVIPIVALASSRQRTGALVALGLLAATTYYLFLSGSTDQLINNYVKSKMSSSGTGIRLAMNVIPSLLLLLFRTRFGFTQNELRLWLIFAVGSLLAAVAYFLSPSSTAIDRIALYLIPLQIVVLSRLPTILGSATRSSMPVLLAVLSYSFATELVWLNFGNAAWTWLPYKSYLTTSSDYVEHQHFR